MNTLFRLYGAFLRARAAARQRAAKARAIRRLDH